MLKIMVFFLLGMYLGAESVHYIYYPTLVEQAEEIEHLYNQKISILDQTMPALALCEEEYIKQHKRGRDFVTESLGLETLTNHK